MRLLDVSVCIPTYQPCPPYLAAALESAASQNPAPREIIVCDDGSSSTSFLVACERELSNSKAKVVRHTTNSGLANGWNRAVAEATSEFVLVLHQDDVLLAGALHTLHSNLKRYSAVQSTGRELIIGPRGEWLRANNRVFHRERYFRSAGCYVLPHRALVYLALRNGQPTGPPSAILFRRDAFLAVGGFSDAFRHACDVELALRLSALGPTVLTSSAVVGYRRHERNATHVNVMSGAGVSDRRALFCQYGHLLSDSERRRAEATLALHWGLDRARRLRTPLQRTPVEWPLEGRAPAASIGRAVLEMALRRNADAKRTEAYITE